MVTFLIVLLNPRMTFQKCLNIIVAFAKLEAVDTFKPRQAFFVLKKFPFNMKFYVSKNKEFVGEAIVINNEIIVHYYNSYGTSTYSVGKLPKNIKLIAKDTK